MKVSRRRRGQRGDAVRAVGEHVGQFPGHGRGMAVSGAEPFRDGRQGVVQAIEAEP